jgi:hypothetical protein
VRELFSPSDPLQLGGRAKCPLLVGWPAYCFILMSPRGLCTTFGVMNTNIKRWSVGSPIHALLDALLDLIPRPQHPWRWRRQTRGSCCAP